MTFANRTPRGHRARGIFGAAIRRLLFRHRSRTRPSRYQVPTINTSVTPARLDSARDMGRSTVARLPDMGLLWWSGTGWNAASDEATVAKRHGPAGVSVVDDMKFMGFPIGIGIVIGVVVGAVIGGGFAIGIGIAIGMVVGAAIGAVLRASSKPQS
jgi:hypothetical protein